jgi:Tol biopolymer transport system component
MTEQLERQLRSVLHEQLDVEVGPHPIWAESPAAQRVIELDGRRRRRWPLRALAVAAMIGIVGGGALLVGSLSRTPDVTLGPSNGWIAFTVAEGEDAVDIDGDHDIWLVSLGLEPYRAIGTDTDHVDQLCPAFSPDGRSLAYGRVEGHGTRYSYSAPGDDRPAAYRKAALMVADVGLDGRVSDRLTVDVGDALPPPCPIWSPDASQVAFAVPRTSPINPTASAAGSEVWVVRLADQHITVLPNLLATDLEWSPDGTVLAIASGVDELVPGEALLDGRIHLYTPSSGAIRVLDVTLGAGSLTWAPDGRRIAYEANGELRLVDTATERQEALVPRFEANQGFGPVWSPNGRTIAYQRVCHKRPDNVSAPCREQHEVVLVTLGDPLGAAAQTEVVLPMFRTMADGSSANLFPFRVTWSPDGDFLLYHAWSEQNDSLLGDFVAAVPTDPERPVVILARGDGIVAYDGYPDTTYVPIQTWARRPLD